jgi:hypothetical protein
MTSAVLVLGVAWSGYKRSSRIKASACATAFEVLIRLFTLYSLRDVYTVRYAVKQVATDSSTSSS